jgi:hypothetical protein
MQRYVQIPRWKGEFSVFLVYGLLVFAISMINRAQFGPPIGWISAGVLLLLFVYLYRRFSGNYFVSADERGISWRQNIMSQLVFIPWNYVEKVDYLLYELNFIIKESGQVVSFATSGLSEEDALELKKVVAHYTRTYSTSDPAAG